MTVIFVFIFAYSQYQIQILVNLLERTVLTESWQFAMASYSLVFNVAILALSLSATHRHVANSPNEPVEGHHIMR